MDEDGASSLKLAVFASGQLDAAALQELERASQILIVGQFRCDQTDFSELAAADVVLIELGQETRRDDVTRLLQEVAKPVLLHSGPVTFKALSDKKLVQKLRELGATSGYRSPTGPVGRVAGEPAWVVALCASVGGPKAIGRFLSALPEGLGVVFLVIQHMAKEFQSLLAAQLARGTRLRVQMMGNGDVLAPETVWIVPADRKITVADGRVKILDGDWGKPNRPCMDEVLGLLARTYRRHCGVILFSGVGNDGLGGSASIYRQGGFVWAQDAASCVVAGLPDAARATGMVELSAAPEALAAALYRRCTLEGRAAL